MKSPEMKPQLTRRWVPVVDARGRTHLEAVWTTAAPRVPAIHAA